MVTIIAPIPSNKCRLGRRRGPPARARLRGAAGTPGPGGAGGGCCHGGWGTDPGRGCSALPGGLREVTERRRSQNGAAPPAWPTELRGARRPWPGGAGAGWWGARPPAGSIPAAPAGRPRSSGLCGAGAPPARRGAVAAGPRVSRHRPQRLPGTPAPGCGCAPRLGCSWVGPAPGPSPNLGPGPGPGPGPGQLSSSWSWSEQSICVPAPVTSAPPAPSQPSVAESRWPGWLGPAMADWGGSAWPRGVQLAPAEPRCPLLSPCSASPSPSLPPAQGQAWCMAELQHPQPLHPRRGPHPQLWAPPPQCRGPSGGQDRPPTPGGQWPRDLPTHCRPEPARPPGPSSPGGEK